MLSQLTYKWMYVLASLVPEGGGLACKGLTLDFCLPANIGTWFCTLPPHDWFMVIGIRRRTESRIMFFIDNVFHYIDSSAKTAIWHRSLCLLYQPYNILEWRVGHLRLPWYVWWGLECLHDVLRCYRWKPMSGLLARQRVVDCSGLGVYDVGDQGSSMLASIGHS